MLVIKKANHRVLVGAALGAIATMLATAAQAQAQAQTAPQVAAAEPLADTEEQIIVTGSRIPRAGFDTVEPASVLGAAQIEARGYTNIGEALSELPAFGVPGSSPVGVQSNFGAGQSFVDFFSLGSQRTLTLVNSRRFVSSNTASIFGPTDAGGQVDLNTIPTTLVDRIETIAVGGAPIYGSDAIAGTVNIILKQRFEGVELRGQTGLSERGDGAEYRISGIAGTSFASGRGNVIVAGEFNKRTGIPTSDRFRTSADGPFFTTADDPASPFAQKLYFDQRFNVFTNSGTPLIFDDTPEFGGVLDADGRVLTFDQSGRLVPLDFGTRTGSEIESSGGNGFRLGDFGNLLTSSERYLGTVQASFEVNDNITLFGEGWYSRSSATNVRDQPVYNTRLFDLAGTSDGNIILSIDNPFLNPADRAIIASNLGEGEDTFLLTRANTDLTSGSGTSVVELYRFVAGARGGFDLGSRKFNYEVSANYGNSTTRSRSRELVQQNFANAVDAVTDANGNIICRPGSVNATIATLSSTCAPLNLFGVDRRSQAALDYITAIARPLSKNDQLVLSGNISSTLFTLPGGEVGYVIGYEHRRESTSFDPGAFFFGEDNGDGTRTQYGRSIPIDPVSGSFTTNEGFAEIRIPLVSPDMGWRFIYDLELKGAARYIDNSLSGGDWTYTLGGSISPFNGIKFRGNYTRAIRSPAITEAFNPTSQAFETGQDPCDGRFIDAGPNPANRAANCAAAGIEQPFVSNYSDFSVPITISGNPNLSNETANSYTFGAVLRPRFIPGLTLAADYVSISLSNAIISLGGDDILDACYDATDFPSSFCSLVTRAANGQIDNIQEGYFNAATREFAGVTAELAYRFGLDKVGLGTNAGDLALSVNYLYVDKQFSQVGTGDRNDNLEGIGNPRHSFTANVNYANGDFSSLVQVQYFGRAKVDPNAALSDYEFPIYGAYAVTNGSVSYQVTKNFDVRFIVDNIFDVSPPFPALAGGGTATYFSGLLGRYFRVSAGVKF